MRAGVVYRITCLTCTKQNRKTVYIGESARTSWDRGVEHLEAIRREDRESPLIEHAQDEHPGDPREFKMEVIKYVSRNLLRQASEAIEIGKHKEFNVINRRGEWGQNLPPKLTVEDDKEDVQIPTKRKARAQHAPETRPPSSRGNSQSSSCEEKSTKRRRTGTSTDSIEATQSHTIMVRADPELNQLVCNATPKIQNQL